MTLITPLPPNVLAAETIYLEPLTDAHYKDLFHMAQHPSIWMHTLSSGLGEAHFELWFAEALSGQNNATQLPFVVRKLGNNELVGSTRFYAMNPSHKHLSIGYTWYHPDVWGTSVNLETKLIMLAQAFDSLNYIRVSFLTDTENKRSQQALLKCGAVQEGILRHHLIRYTGTIRDSVLFSIIQTDWANTRIKLQHLIKKKLSSVIV